MKFYNVLKEQSLSEKLIISGLITGAFFIPVSISGAVFASLLGLLGSVIYILKYRIKVNLIDKNFILFLMFFLVSGLISMLFSIDIVQSANRYRVIISEVSMAFLFILLNDDNEKTITRKILLILFISTVIESLFGITEYITGKNIFDRPDDFIYSPIRRVKGTLGYFTSLGMALGMLFPFFTAIVISDIKCHKKYSYLEAAGLLIIFLCLVFTFTRGAWLGVLCALLLMGIIKSKKLMHLTLLLLLIFFFLPVTRNRIFQTFINPDKERIYIWKSNIDMIKKRPLYGWGQDTFEWIFYTFYSTKPEALAITNKKGERIFLTSKHHFHSHNVYIGLLQETGILGLITFIILLYLAIKKTLKITIKRKSEWEGIIAWGLFGLLVDFIIHSLFDYPLRAETGYLFWLLMGLVFSIKEDENSIS